MEMDNNTTASMRSSDRQRHGKEEYKDLEMEVN
jgi:hypothetical protein